MTQKGLKGLLNEEPTLGGDIAIIAGPVGRHAEASIDFLCREEFIPIPEARVFLAGSP